MAESRFRPIVWLGTTQDDIRAMRDPIKSRLGQELLSVQSGGMLFYAISDTPEEAANRTARGVLMIAIQERIKVQGWTQAQAAEVLHVTQPRVSDLMNNKIDRFSLDALVNMLPAVGLTFDVRPVA
jgi:predicted XRE-type DNA-binding protein